MTKIKEASLGDFIPDDLNANLGTKRGRAMLADSVRQYGAGRSILVDRKGRVIAGNKTVEAAVQVGLEGAVVVQSDGDKLIVVQRTDIDLDSTKGRALALADNRTGEVNLDWDPTVLRELIQRDQNLLDHWAETELFDLLGEVSEVDDPHAEWQGMPEFEQSDLRPNRQIIVSFETDKDVKAFAKLTGTKISDKTRSVWYPHKEKGSMMDHVYVAEE